MKSASPPQSSTRKYVDCLATASTSEVCYARLLEWTTADDFKGTLTLPSSRQYLFIHSGGGVAEMDIARFELEAGVLLLVPEGTKFNLSLKQGTRGVWLAGSDDFLNQQVAGALHLAGPEYWLSYHVPKCLPLFMGSEAKKQRDLIEEELEAACDRLGHSCDSAIVAYFFVILSIPRSGDTPRPRMAVDEALQSVNDPSVRTLMRFRGLVETSFRKHLPVNIYARQLGVTPGRLARLCLDFAQRTPLGIIHERIMLEAKRELATSPNSIAEVAYGLGFSDPAYFSRFFRQHAGTAPITFRETMMVRPDTTSH